MDKLTYTAIGAGKDIENGILSFDVYLPQEDPQNPYIITPLFDLSKFQLFDKNINVIFCHLNVPNGDGVLSGNFTKRVDVAINELEDYDTRINRKFNFNNEETLVLLYHENINEDEEVDISVNYINELYNNVNLFYEVAKFGNFVTTIPTNFPKDRDTMYTGRPRTLGLSIIR